MVHIHIPIPLSLLDITPQHLFPGDIICLNEISSEQKICLLLTGILNAWNSPAHGMHAMHIYSKREWMVLKTFWQTKKRTRLKKLEPKTQTQQLQGHALCHSPISFPASPKYEIRSGNEPSWEALG